MDKLAAYESLLEDRPLWAKEANFVDTPYGKIHEDDASYLAGHLSFGDEDDPK